MIVSHSDLHKLFYDQYLSSCDISHTTQKFAANQFFLTLKMKCACDIDDALLLT